MLKETNAFFNILKKAFAQYKFNLFFCPKPESLRL